MSRTPWFVPALAIVSGLGLACSSTSDSSGAGGSDAAGNGGSNGGAGNVDCAGTPPATMVTLPEGYAIDSTEVTRCQYQAWLATTPSTSDQDAWCSWNTSFTPTCEWPPADKGTHPVVCVDWCDAYAYCKGVGKRLCGRIGGGENSYQSYASLEDQLYNACVSGGAANAYPYGNTYESQTCNGADLGIGTTVEVGSLVDCQSSVSGYAGVYDLSGNVVEWEDSCNAHYNQSDQCRVRGGSFLDSGTILWLRCDGGDTAGYGERGSSIGVNAGLRCCGP